MATIVAAMEEAQVARTEAFFNGLYEDGFADRFLVRSRIEAAAGRVRAGGAPADAAGGAPGTGSARRPTSPPWTATGAARRSPARTAPGRA